MTVLVVTMAQFMAVMSTSVVSVALPTIGRDLHASSTSLEWIVDAYVIVFVGRGDRTLAAIPPGYARSRIDALAAILGVRVTAR